MYIGLHVKCLFFVYILMKIWMFWENFREKKTLETKSNENLFGGSLSVPCAKTDGRTDMDLMVALTHFCDRI